MTQSPKTIQQGEEIPSFIKQMKVENMGQPLMAGDNPIHWDDAYAKKAGLPAPIATGMMSTAYLSQMLTEYFGLDWVKGGRLSFSFIKPVFVEDTLTCRGWIKERAGEGSKANLTLEVWVENQHGEKVTVGEAALSISTGP
jgi:acyl dehydratase